MPNNEISPVVTNYVSDSTPINNSETIAPELTAVPTQAEFEAYPIARRTRSCVEAQEEAEWYVGKAPRVQEMHRKLASLHLGRRLAAQPHTRSSSKHGQANHADALRPSRQVMGTVQPAENSELADSLLRHTSCLIEGLDGACGVERARAALECMQHTASSDSVSRRNGAALLAVLSPDLKINEIIAVLISAALLHVKAQTSTKCAASVALAVTEVEGNIMRAVDNLVYGAQNTSRQGRTELANAALKALQEVLDLHEKTDQSAGSSLPAKLFAIVRGEFFGCGETARDADHGIACDTPDIDMDRLADIEHGSISDDAQDLAISKEGRLSDDETVAIESLLDLGNERTAIRTASELSPGALRRSSLADDERESFESAYEGAAAAAAAAAAAKEIQLDGLGEGASEHLSDSADRMSLDGNEDLSDATINQPESDSVSQQPSTSQLCSAYPVPTDNVAESDDRMINTREKELSDSELWDIAMLDQPLAIQSGDIDLSRASDVGSVRSDEYKMAQTGEKRRRVNFEDATGDVNDTEDRSSDSRPRKKRRYSQSSALTVHDAELKGYLRSIHDARIPLIEDIEWAIHRTRLLIQQNEASGYDGYLQHQVQEMYAALEYLKFVWRDAAREPQALEAVRVLVPHQSMTVLYGDKTNVISLV